MATKTKTGARQVGDDRPRGGRPPEVLTEAQRTDLHAQVNSALVHAIQGAAIEFWRELLPDLKEISRSAEEISRATSRGHPTEPLQQELGALLRRAHSRPQPPVVLGIAKEMEVVTSVRAVLQELATAPDLCVDDLLHRSEILDHHIDFVETIAFPAWDAIASRYRRGDRGRPHIAAHALIDWIERENASIMAVSREIAKLGVERVLWPISEWIKSRAETGLEQVAREIVTTFVERWQADNPTLDQAARSAAMEKNERHAERIANRLNELIRDRRSDGS